MKCLRVAPRCQVAPSGAGSEAGSAARVWERASITGPAAGDAVVNVGLPAE